METNNESWRRNSRLTVHGNNVRYVQKSVPGGVCADLFLALQHLASPPVARLTAAACWETQPAALDQHRPLFPQPLVKRSGNEKNGHNKHNKIIPFS